MKLMTKEIIKRIPPLYSTEDVDAKDKIIHVKVDTLPHFPPVKQFMALR